LEGAGVERIRRLGASLRGASLSPSPAIFLRLFLEIVLSPPPTQDFISSRGMGITSGLIDGIQLAVRSLNGLIASSLDFDYEFSGSEFPPYKTRETTAQSEQREVMVQSAVSASPLATTACI